MPMTRAVTHHFSYSRRTRLQPRYIAFRRYVIYSLSPISWTSNVPSDLLQLDVVDERLCWVEVITIVPCKLLQDLWRLINQTTTETSPFTLCCPVLSLSRAPIVFSKASRLSQSGLVHLSDSPHVHLPPDTSSYPQRVYCQPFHSF